MSSVAPGCAKHTARIVDRSGAIVTDATTLLTVEWARVLDDSSAAKVVVQPDGNCCERLGQVRSWRHDLQIFREGRPVWEGPIILPVWKAGSVEITAVDAIGWLDRRVPHQDMRFEGTDLVDIGAWLIRDAFAPHDPGHEVQIVGPTKIRGDRAYQLDVGQTGDHLRALAKTGLDFTTVGRRIVLLPEDHCARIGSLTDADFPSGLSISEDGASLATRVVLHGSPDSGIKGVAGGMDPYYGLLERAVEESSVLDELSATSGARSRLRSSHPAPVFLDTSQETTIAPRGRRRRRVAGPRLVPGRHHHADLQVHRAEPEDRRSEGHRGLHRRERPRAACPLGGVRLWHCEVHRPAAPLRER